MLHKNGFRHHGTRPARPGEPGDRRQQMQKKDGQIAHRAILARSRHARNAHEFWNSPCTGEYSSWAHDKGVPAKVVAQIMGHTKVDTTMNVYTQVLDGAARLAADRVGSELFRVVQIPDGTTTPTR